MFLRVAVAEQCAALYKYSDVLRCVEMSLPTKLKALSSHYDWRHPPSWWSSPCKNNFIFPPLPLIIRLAALAQYLIFKVNLDLTIHHQSWEDHLGINCKNTKYTRPRWTDTKLSWCDKFGRTRTILNMKTFKFYNKESSICDSSTQSELKHFVMRVGDWNINSFSLFLSLKAEIMWRVKLICYRSASL